MNVNPFDANAEGLEHLLGIKDLVFNKPQHQEQPRTQNAEVSGDIKLDGLSGDIQEYLQKKYILEQKAKSGQRITVEEMMDFQTHGNMLKTWKDQYIKYNDTVREEGAGSEFAINERGQVLVKGDDGNLRPVNINDVNYSMKDRILTYGDIAMYREEIRDNKNRNILSNFLRDVTSKNSVFKHIREIAGQLGRTKIESEAGTSSGVSASGKAAYDFISGGETSFSSSFQPSKEQLVSALNHTMNELNEDQKNRVRLMARLDPTLQEVDSDSGLGLAIYNSLYAFNDLEYKRKEIQRVKENLGLGNPNNGKVSFDSMKDMEHWTNLVQSMAGAQNQTIRFGNYEVFGKAKDWDLKSHNGTPFGAGIEFTEYLGTGLASGMINYNDYSYIFGKKIPNNNLAGSLIAEPRFTVEMVPFNDEIGMCDTDYMRKLSKLKESGTFNKEMTSYLEHGPKTESNTKEINKIFNKIGLPSPYNNNSATKKPYQFSPEEPFDISRYTTGLFSKAQPFLTHKLYVPKTNLPEEIVKDKDAYYDLGDKNIGDNNHIRIVYNLLKDKKKVGDKENLDNSTWFGSDNNACYTKVYTPITNINESNRFFIYAAPGMSGSIEKFSEGVKATNLYQSAKEDQLENANTGIVTGNSVMKNNF